MVVFFTALSIAIVTNYFIPGFSIGTGYLKINSQVVSIALNPDRSNGFTQPHYTLLNLAIGGNGGTPKASTSTIRYKVDYVRVCQKN